MKVFLVGEGRHDIGDLAAEPPYRGEKPGFLQPVVEKLVRSEAAFDGAKVTLLSKKRVSSRREALEGQARLAVALATNAGSNLLVFVRDLDRGSGTGRRKAAAEIKRMSEEIRRGCETHAAEDLQCVPGIPCRTIEAWALGDRAAVAELCGSTEPVELPDGKAPEDLWGKPRDPSSNHPKMILKRILGRDGTQQDLSTIAERADPKAVRESCPLSFEPFAAELEGAVAAHGGAT
jgi:Domain of unknown function (DUF4276)